MLFKNVLRLYFVLRNFAINFNTKNVYIKGVNSGLYCSAC